MANIDDNLRAIAARIRDHSSAILTEEAVKTAVVLPFLSALGYDVFDPNEVIPEFTADAVGKKGERVDYAVKVGGQIRILIECKPISTTLEKLHLAQLYRYFSVTSARFAMLTNGRTFNFYTDLDEPNKLDTIPFLIFDLADLQASILLELKRFAKGEFDFAGIRASASRLKYISSIKRRITEKLETPNEEIVRLFCAGLYDGRFTQATMDQFSPLTKAAFRDLIRDAVQTRLSTALADTSAPETAETAEVGEDLGQIVTTQEETEGFLIIKAIVRDVISATRVSIRDQKSYCGVLVDNNNRKPLARLHFNRSIKYVGLFDGGKEERVKITTLDNIYDLAERLRRSADAYARGAIAEIPAEPSA